MRVWQSHQPGESHRILHNAGRSGKALARNGSQAGSLLAQNSPLVSRLRVHVGSMGDHYVDCAAHAFQCDALRANRLADDPGASRHRHTMDFPHYDRGNLLFRHHYTGRSVRAG